MRKRNFKHRLAAICLSTAMLFTALSGCGSSASSADPADSPSVPASASADETVSNENTEEAKGLVTTDYEADGIQLSKPGEFPIVKGERIELTAFVAPQQDKFSEFDAELNEITAWLEEKTNIHINWQIVGKADRVSKLNLMFNSGEYPDIIFFSGLGDAAEYLYGSSGMLLPLNDMIDQYGYYTQQIFESYDPAMSESLISLDGNIYSLGIFNDAKHMQYQGRMWIYQPWLDALGLEMPTTTEEFYEVLKAFKEQDPNGNGIADEIPFTGSLATNGWSNSPIDFVMNAFLYYNPSGANSIILEDGKVKMAYAQEEYREGLKFLNRLYADGLLDPNAFTQDTTQLKGLTSHDTQIVGCVGGGSYTSFTTTTSGQDGDWVNFKPLAPLAGPEGVRYAQYSIPSVGANFLITDKCKYPNAAFRLADALDEQEIGMNGHRGMKGEHWDYAEEGETGLDGNPAKWKVLASASVGTSDETNYAWGQVSNAKLPAGWHTAQAVLGDPALDVEALLYNAATIYEEFAPPMEIVWPTVPFNETQAQTIADINATLNSFVLQEAVRFITEGGIDEGWDQYLKELENRRVDELAAVYQEAYDARMAVLNG